MVEQVVWGKIDTTEAAGQMTSLERMICSVDCDS